MNERLHPFQIAILIYMTQSGVTLFSIPRLTAEAFGTNGWAGLIIVFIIININILLISLCYKFGHGRSIFEILESNIFRWFLIPFYLAVSIVFIVLAVLVTKKYIILLKILFYQETPFFVFFCMALLLSYMLLTGGIYQIGKTTIVLFFITIWTVFLLAFPIKEFEIIRLTPFLFQGEKSIFKDGMNVYTAFLGFELSLLLFPYVQKKWTKSIFIGNAITTIIYLGVSFVSYGFFSFEQLKMEMYPVITILESIDIPFIERVENAIFSLFSLKVLITIVMYFWAATIMIKQVNHNVNSKIINIVVLLVGYFISLIPKVLRDVDLWLKWFTYILSSLAMIIPILLLLIIFIENFLKSRRKISQ
ncbi:GerAB/ArcD/ProY family transporter [Bacillus sp. CHD6a]|uniref:GerAB/ArcD/ProY family transporter n=1 Tax=Bacillus sp. CHD6a TaxID=1643452 RepID=UPI0006CD6CA7|nr:GerAB/ArcD/ProY family transporter [Bacillus sp. CHD6a]KPB06287.1 hypothetical protein AAV98_00325 [Bacillus sp. CHD6a]